VAEIPELASNLAVRRGARAVFGIAIAGLVQNKFHGLSLGTGGWLVLTWATLVLSGVYLLLTERFVRKRLPTLHVERKSGVEGTIMRIVPPEHPVLGRGTRKRRARLRAAALELVSDMRAYLAEQSAPMVDAMDQHQAATDAMHAAPNDQERRRLWNAQGLEMAEQMERERQQLASRFGGRIEHVLAEYARLGVIEDGAAVHIRELCGSKWWLSQAASKIEGIAQQL
jgi:hypothetical protein